MRRPGIAARVLTRYAEYRSGDHQRIVYHPTLLLCDNRNFSDQAFWTGIGRVVVCILGRCQRNKAKLPLRLAKGYELSELEEFVMTAFLEEQ